MSMKLGPLNRQQIMDFLPHREPFLFLDSVEEIIKVSDSPKMGREHVGTIVRATKNVNADESHFRGHFPGNPIMPGVLLIESMAQACAMSFYRVGLEKTFSENYAFFLVGTENMRFRKVVVPGDVLKIETKLMKAHSSLVVFECSIAVNGALTASGTVLSQVKELI